VSPAHSYWMWMAQEAMPIPRLSKANFNVGTSPCRPYNYPS